MGKHHKNVFTVRFARPRRNCLDVFVRYEYQTIKFHPTFAPSDPLGDLIHGLLKILNGASRATVLWQSKSMEYEFIFEPQGDELQVKVRECLRLRIGSIGTRVHCWSGSPYQVLRPFWKALRDFEAEQLIPKYENDLGRDFPLRELRELGEKIVDLKPSPQAETRLAGEKRNDWQQN
jgi:hypothetical protein